MRLKRNGPLVTSCDARVGEIGLIVVRARRITKKAASAIAPLTTAHAMPPRRRHSLVSITSGCVSANHFSAAPSSSASTGAGSLVSSTDKAVPWQTPAPPPWRVKALQACIVAPVARHGP